MTTARKAIVRWTDDEEDRVADEAARLRKEDPLPTLLQIVRQAINNVLDEDRRRNPVGWDELVGMKDKIALRLALDERLPPAREPPPPPIIIKEPAPEPPTVDEILASLGDEELLWYATNRLGEGAVISHAMLLWGRTVQSIHDTQTKMAEAVGMMKLGLNAIQDHLTLPKTSQPAAPRERRPPRIVLISNRWKEAADMRHRVGRAADLVFISKDMENREVPTGADWVILMTRFISHSAQEKVLAAYKQEHHKVVKHDGTANTVVEVVLQLAEKTRKARGEK